VNSRRKFIAIGISVVVVAAVVWGFMPKPIPADAVKAVRAPMSVTVVEEGKTRVIDRFDISAPVAGFARRIELEAGDIVKKGQMVAVLEPQRSAVLDPRSHAEAEARVKAAEASLSAAKQDADAARAEAEYAQSEFDRLSKLHDNGFISGDRYDRAEADQRHAQATLHSANFAVQVAEYELDAARTALMYSAANSNHQGLKNVSITSPVDGSVLKVLHKSEGKVEAGDILLSVGDPGAIEVETDVLSDDAVRIKPGMKVLYERWGGDKPLEGEVTRVEPGGFTKVSALGVEEQRVYVISDFTSSRELWERLGDAYRVEANFILWEGQDVLQVPESALFRNGGDGWAVFVARNGHAVLSPVKLGHRSGLAAEVVSGVKEGDLVLTHPDESIEDGSSIRLR